MAESCNAYTIPGVGLTASGNSPVFFLSPAPRTVLLASIVTSVAGSGSLQMTLQACVGDPGLAISWTNVVALSTQSSTGTVNATAAAPSALAGSNPMWRIAWTVVGNGGAAIVTAAGVN